MTPNKIKELRIIRYLIVYEEMEHQLQCGLHERARLEHELRKYTTPRKGYHELKMYQYNNELSIIGNKKMLNKTKQFLDGLEPTEKDMLIDRYQHYMTASELSNKYGINQADVLPMIDTIISKHLEQWELD